MKINKNKALLVGSLLWLASIAGCGSRDSFIATANAQEGQNLGLPASIIPVEPFVQLNLEVPFRPTVFPSGANQFLTYELNVTNMIPLDYDLKRVEVLNSDTNQTVASFTGSDLREIVRLSGTPPIDAESDEPITLAKGETAIVFFFLDIPLTETLPQNLSHRLVVGTNNGERILNHETIVAVDTTPPVALAPPMTGGPWFCDGAPGADSYHRRTLLAVNGLARISQRYAIDFEILTPEGRTFSGDPTVNSNYPAYGQPILASAPGTVVKVIDGLPDNTPPQVPPTTNVDTVGGNGVIMDIGQGRFLVHGHMQPGSITVSEGDTVALGQQLGLIGNSGNSFEPHLHLQVVDKPSFLAAQGLPWVLSNYELVEGNSATPVQNQLPLLNQVINFPGSVAAGPVPHMIAARSHPVCGWH